MNDPHPLDAATRNARGHLRAVRTGEEAPIDPVPARPRVARAGGIALLLVLGGALGIGLIAERREVVRLNAELAGLRAELDETRAALEAQRARLGEVRARVGGLRGEIESLDRLLANEPLPARPAARDEDPGEAR